MISRFFFAFLPLMSAFAQTAYHANVRYANTISGSQIAKLASDASGDFFIVSQSTDLAGRQQIRVDKVDPDGNPLANFEFGGSAQDNVNAVADDAEGNLIIVGGTSSQDFPLVSPLNRTTESYAAFITKIDSKLENILFSTKLGGTQLSTNLGGTQVSSYAGAVALDASGNIYVTGETADADFPTSPGAFQKQGPQSNQSGAAEYAFLTAIAANGGAILFSTYFGDSAVSCTPGPTFSCPPFAATYGTAITLDSTGNVVIAGNTTANHLPVTPGVFGPNCGGCGISSPDASLASFLAKFSPDGTKLVWATYLPAVVSASEIAADVEITAVALDASGNVIAAGTNTIVSPASPGPIVNIQTSGFITKFDAGVAKLLFSTTFGEGTQQNPSLVASVGGITVDAQDAIWITGANYLAGVSLDSGTLSPIFSGPSGIAGLGIVTTSRGTTALGGSGSLLTASIGQAPSLTAIANSAGYAVSGDVAPYELVSLYGLGLGSQNALTAQVVNGILGNALAGVQVLFDGIPAPLLYAGPTQINAIVPVEVYGNDTTSIQVVTPAGKLDGPTMQVRLSQPGVFVNPAPSLETPASPAAALNQDGSVNSLTNPATLGSIVSVWVSGAGISTAPLPDGTIRTFGPTSTNYPGGVPTLPISAFSSPLGFFGIQQAIGPNVPGTAPELLPGALSLQVLAAEDAPDLVAGVTQINLQLPSQLDVPGPPDLLTTIIGTFGITLWLQIGDASTEPFTIYLTEQ